MDVHELQGSIGAGIDGEVPRDQISGLWRGGRRARRRQRGIEPGCSAFETWWRSPKPPTRRRNLAIIGRYVLTPDIFASIEAIEPGSGAARSS